MNASPDDSEMANVFGARFPRAISPVYSTPEPNKPISLYEDAIQITQGQATYSAIGSLYLEWLPRPRITFNIKPDSSFAGIRLSPGKATLNLRDARASTDAMITNTHFGFGDAELKSPVSGRISHSELGDPSGLSRLIFHVVNFADYHGDPVQGTLATLDGRALIHAADWKVTLDKVSLSNELFKKLDATGGFAVTHVGTLEKANNDAFDINDADAFMEAITVYLSFCRGCSIAPLLYVGLDAAGQQVFRRWELTRKIQPWSKPLSWFHDQTIEGLTNGFPSFFELWQNETWKDPLSFALHWYREANSSAGGIEGAIIMAQAAFELLSWNYLVVERKTLSDDGFQKLPAWDKMRLFLAGCDIPLQIPASLPELAKVASAENWVDGPHALAALRNALVHPDPRKRARILGNNVAFRIEAWLLTMWFLEVSFLRLFKYEGRYANRLIREGFDGAQIEFLPWHRPNTK